MAISVASDRLAGSQMDRVRAVAPLTAFTNALVVSLFSLNPVVHLGGTTITVGIIGVLFVAASLLSFVRTGVPRSELSLNVGLLVVFVLQLIVGPSVGIGDALKALVRRRRDTHDDPTG